jgi:hypothetical protein
MQKNSKCAIWITSHHFWIYNNSSFDVVFQIINIPEEETKKGS